MTRKAVAVIFLLALLFLIACDDDYSLEDQYDDALSPVHTELRYFKDAHDRYVYLNGVNLSGSTKVPATIDPISYVGKPFPLEEADHHFRILQKVGFNSVRLLIMWESIEPYASGEYDEEFLDYLEQVVALAAKYNIYCLIDMHQDMFSRHVRKYFDNGTENSGLVFEETRERVAPFGLNDVVAGDGAPQWVVQLALPEKNVGGPEWGLPYNLVSDRKNTSDMLPWTTWFLNMGTSLDLDRCYASMFAGDLIWPNYTVEGKSIKDYLQDSYANAFAEVAKRVGHYPNVIGYETMNEPGGIFIMLVINALLYNEAKDAPGGELGLDGALEILDTYLADQQDRGMPADQAELLREIIVDYDLLPTNLAQLQKSGFWPASDTSPYRPDLGAAIAVNSNFNKNYLLPFHERVAHRILEADPDAVIFMEEAMTLGDRGIAGQWAQPMTPPTGVEQYVFAPHKYTDIYPFIGFNQPPREFEVNEIRYRDYETMMHEAIDTAAYSFGNPPVVIGEFGTYFNYGGIDQSIENNYIVSTAILDPYFEAFEKMLLNRILWCYSAENDKFAGDLWNKEDFSILDFNGKLRSWQAYSRTVPRATSGRIESMHFYSPLHYFEPIEDELVPVLEFEMEMKHKETDTATEIFVPPLQYTDGFYVRVSDGSCAYDPKTFVLYWYPANDDPDFKHNIRIRPPYPDYPAEDWDYFFDGETILENNN